MRVTTWRFARDHVERRVAWFGLGWTTRYPFDQLDRLEVRRSVIRANQKLWTLFSMIDWTVRYTLVAVDRHNREVATIPDLTLGEAQWMADAALKSGVITFA